MTRNLLFFVLALASGMTHAAVPGFIPYSGRLTDGAYGGASTTANLRVLLYTCACASDAPDSETCTAATRCAAGSTGLYFDGFHQNVPIVDGYFTLLIGMYDAVGTTPYPDPASTALTPKLPLPERLWVTVSVNGESELDPRQVVGSVPYATLATQSGTASRLAKTGAGTVDARGLFATVQFQTYLATCQGLALQASSTPLRKYARLVRIDNPTTTSGNASCPGVGSGTGECLGVFSIETAEVWQSALSGFFAGSMHVKSCSSAPGNPPASNLVWAACCKYD